MNLETKITIYKFTPQVFTLTPYFFRTALFFSKNRVAFYLELCRSCKPRCKPKKYIR